MDIVGDKIKDMLSDIKSNLKDIEENAEDLKDNKSADVILKMCLDKIKAMECKLQAHCPAFKKKDK